MPDEGRKKDPTLYTPLHITVRDNIKVKKLGLRLGLKRYESVGHLCMLWTWAMQYADDGDLGDVSNEDVALAADYEGDPDTFANALIASGLLTKDRQINDWEVYGGKVHESRRKAREKVADWRAKRAETTASDDDVTVTLRPKSKSKSESKSNNYAAAANSSSNVTVTQTDEPCAFERMMGDDAIAYFVKSLGTKIPGLSERQFRSILRSANEKGGDIEQDELDRRLTSVRELADHIADRQKSQNPQRRLTSPHAWAVKAMNARMSGDDEIEGLLR